MDRNVKAVVKKLWKKNSEFLPRVKKVSGWREKSEEILRRWWWMINSLSSLCNQDDSKFRAYAEKSNPNRRNQDYKLFGSAPIVRSRMQIGNLCKCEKLLELGSCQNPKTCPKNPLGNSCLKVRLPYILSTGNYCPRNPPPPIEEQLMKGVIVLGTWECAKKLNNPCSQWWK